MVMTASSVLALGSPMPHFALDDALSGQRIDSRAFDGQVVVTFICNHCPFVIHLLDHFTQSANHWMTQGVNVVAISSNDIQSHPADAPDKMAELAESRGFLFPYCFDQDQQVAKAFHAACTPEFYVFDQDLALYYHGQYDASRPGNDEMVSGEDMRAAVAAMLDRAPPPSPQQPSVGCNIKWRP